MGCFKLGQRVSVEWHPAYKIELTSVKFAAKLYKYTGLYQSDVNHTLPVEQHQRRKSSLCSSDGPETVNRCKVTTWPPPAAGCWSGPAEQDRPRIGRPSRQGCSTLLGQAWWALKGPRQQPSWTFWLSTTQVLRDWVLTSSTDHSYWRRRVCQLHKTSPWYAG